MAAATSPPKTAAWRVVWRCGCSDAQPERATLSLRCPCHRAEATDVPQQIETALGLGHWCPPAKPHRPADHPRTGETP